MEHFLSGLLIVNINTVSNEDDSEGGIADIVKMTDEERGTMYVCPCCPYVSDRKSKVRRHMDSQHKHSEPVYCTICNKKAVNVHALKSHMLRYHRDSVL